MSVTSVLPRGIVAAVIAAVLAFCAIVQAASMSFVHEPGTASALVPRAFGRAVYHALDRIAPAAYVEETLATDALERGDTAAARHYAVRLPAGGRRDELLGRIAEARGEIVLAREYYFAAPDVERMQSAIAALAKSDLPAAYALEIAFAQRLDALRTHPDAVAESYFFAGNYADSLGRHPLALQNYRRALALAPLNEKYLVSAGTEAYFHLHDAAAAANYYRACLSVDPGSSDCSRLLRVVEAHGR